jgi:RimJ/RimL family protein N-acetyltransferase
MLNNLVLKKLEPSDINEVYLRNLNDRNHMKYSRNRNFDHTKQTQEEYLSGFNQIDNLIFSLKDRNLDIFIGTVSCHIDYDALTINLGFLVFREYSNQGYGLKAVGVIKEYLSHQFPGMTLLIGTELANVAMQKIVISTGFLPVHRPPSVNDQVVHFKFELPQTVQSRPSSIPDIVKNATKIGVAAHDAGGAEQISWLLNSITASIKVFATGPALGILKEQNRNVLFVSEMMDLDDSDLIITGSGWMTDFEISALAYARDAGILTITLIDHFVNYAERFKGESTSLLQIVAVSNQVALEIALDTFQNKMIYLLPDIQLDYYRNHLLGADIEKNTILVVLEPISSTTHPFMISHEIRNQLYEFALKIRQISTDKVIVRPHPSESQAIESLFDSSFLAEYFEISNSRTLLEDLIAARCVIGMSSYALYLAHKSGIPTYSVFAGKYGHWTSRFPRILGF